MPIAELYLLRKLRGGSTKEGFDRGDERGPPPPSSGLDDAERAWLVVRVVAWILVGMFAAYLSWTSNGLIGWNAGFRVVYAFFAFIFGTTYIIAHLVLKLDLVQAVRRLGGAGSTVQQRGSVQRSAAARPPQAVAQ